MKHQIRYLFLTVFVIVAACAAHAASAPPPPGGGTTPPCWPPPCIPIDGGIGFLVAAAAVYGGKKLYDAQKKS